MSFGEGDLHAQVDRLKGVNGSLCAEINRQERVIEQLRARIAELESLVRDWQELYENPDYGDCCRLTRRMRELGIEVGE